MLVRNFNTRKSSSCLPSALQHTSWFVTEYWHGNPKAAAHCALRNSYVLQLLFNDTLNTGTELQVSASMEASREALPGETTRAPAKPGVRLSPCSTPRVPRNYRRSHRAIQNLRPTCLQR
jgi:hypothetical protein